MDREMRVGAQEQVSWERLLADSHLLMRLFPISFQTQYEQQAFALCRVRAARLKLALAFYQVQEGKPAPSEGSATGDATAQGPYGTPTGHSRGGSRRLANSSTTATEGSSASASSTSSNVRVLP